MGGGNGTAQMVETFQRTLDNFHAIREQGIQVHQEFLQQQAAFSERYLQALESGQPTRPSTQEKAPIKTLEREVTEWVVQQPAIVVDDYPPVEPQSSLEGTISPPSSPDLERQSEQSSGISSAELAEALLEIVAEKTGYPAEMLELNMDLEADLGIDSIKRVEILGALEDRYPSLPPADTETLGQTRSLQEILDYLDSEAGSLKSATIPAPNSPPAPDVSTADDLQPPADSAVSDQPSFNTLRQALLGIVAEKTGYPSEMLEMDMDMEADLGIDSIKRVEILGAMEEQFPEIPSLDTDILAGLRTLGQIVELMGNAPPSPAVPLSDPVT
ncbi:MAG: phosphopantetheine-binding protein [Anaerolineales bacterium]